MLRFYLHFHALIPAPEKTTVIGIINSVLKLKLFRFFYKLFLHFFIILTEFLDTLKLILYYTLILYLTLLPDWHKFLFLMTFGSSFVLIIICGIRFIRRRGRLRGLWFKCIMFIYSSSFTVTWLRSQCLCQSLNHVHEHIIFLLNLLFQWFNVQIFVRFTISYYISDKLVFFWDYFKAIWSLLRVMREELLIMRHYKRAMVLKRVVGLIVRW